MDRPGPTGPCPPPRGRPHGQARAAQVKEAATAKRPRREMHSPPMPASKPPCVATARSWPTAPAGDGRTQCDSLCAAPGPVACRRLGPVCQPGASPLRSRAVTGQAQARWPHVLAAKAIRAVFGGWWRQYPPSLAENLSKFVCLRSTSISTSTFWRPGPPVFAVRREPRIHRPTACTYLLGCTYLIRTYLYVTPVTPMENF